MLIKKKKGQSGLAGCHCLTLDLIKDALTKKKISAATNVI